MSNCVSLKITSRSLLHNELLILRRIVKIVATKCQILRLKCTKIAGGTYSAPPDPLAGFKGSYF